MSISPRNKTGATSADTSIPSTSINQVIDKVKQANNNTETTKEDVDKLSKEISSIAKTMKEYVNRQDTNTNKDGDSPVQARTNKICKVYGCIYKGTYDGIVDGLKKVADDEKATKIQDVEDLKRKEFVKSIVQSPITIAKGIVKFLDYRESEIVQLMTRMKYGVQGKGRDYDWQKKSYELSVKQDYDQKKLLKSGSIATQNEQMITELAGIREAVGGGGDRSMFKRDETQIALLKRISEGVGNQKRGFFNLQNALRPKFMMNMSIYQIRLLRNIDANTKEMGSTFRGGFFGFFKDTESQTDILRDIRRYLAPRVKDQNKLWKKLNAPVLSMFSKETQREKANIGDLNAGIQDMVLELEHNTDYNKDILLELNRHGALNRMRAVDGKELLQRIDRGVPVVPLNTDLSPFELDSLKYLAGIELYNRHEYDAIGELSKSLCACVAGDKKDDDLLSSMESTRQDNIERGMDDKEEKRDALSRQGALQNTVEGIHGILLNQSKFQGKAQEEGSVLKSVIGKVTGGIDVLDDALSVGDRVKDMFDGKQGQIVSLSDQTIKDMCKCFNQDDFDLPGKRRRGSRRGAQLPEIPKKKKKLLQKVKDIPKSLKKAPKGLMAKGGKLAVAGASALSVPTALVAGAGAAGYGIGTLLNKKIDSFMQEKTGSASLGDWFYDFTHKGEAKKRKKQQENLEKKLETNRIKRLQAKGAVIDPKTGKALALPAMGASVEGAKKILTDTAGSLNKAMAEGNLLSKGAGIAGAGATATMSLAKDVAEKTYNLKNLEWQDSVNNGWQATVKSMDELSDSIGILAALKESQTTTAIQQVYADGKSFATGGNNTTNLSIPISPHDSDRGTDLLVASLGA